MKDKLTQLLVLLLVQDQRPKFLETVHPFLCVCMHAKFCMLHLKFRVAYILI